ncbi:MAG: very short patch repair endonuclease [Acidimicrobiales bacterium]
MRGESFASSPAIRHKMQQQRRHDTSIERALRSEIFRRGLRYFVHRRPVEGLRREADIVFPRVRVAVFVDSCWWHACPVHRTMPRANRNWWESKLQRNRERDLDTTRRFEAAGWQVVRVWEHEDIGEAAQRVADVVACRRRATTTDSDRRVPLPAPSRESAVQHLLPASADSPDHAGT